MSEVGISVSTAPARSSAREASRSRIDLASIIVIIVVFLAAGGAAFFGYRASSLKSQLMQARSDVQKQRAALQSQIAAANAKVRESVDQLAPLQSQVDQARAEAANARANAEQLSGQITEFQTRLEQARQESDAAKVNAEKASAEVTQLKAQLKEQTSSAVSAPDQLAQPKSSTAGRSEAAGLGQLPMNVAIKKAPIGNGNALSFQNTSAGSLSLTVKFSNQTGSREYYVKLEPGTAKELGWVGDWLLASGDRIELSAAGYDVIVKTVP
jgi:hypothetical protein